MLEVEIENFKIMFVYRYDAKQVMRGVKRTNTIYGALQFQATHVVFIHGSVDPWHALGITRTIRQDLPAIYIRGVWLLYYFLYKITVAMTLQSRCYK